MSRWRLASMLLAGIVSAGVSHWMMVFHPHAPWAMAVLLGPLWLTALGLGGARFGGLGVAVAAVAGGIAFWLIARGADLPLLLTVLGALGGALAFGFLGLFLGPVLLAVAFTIIRDWTNAGHTLSGPLAM